MSIKAVATIMDIDSGTVADTFNLLIKYVASDNLMTDTINILNAPMGILQLALNNAIKDAVKAKMLTQAYTFGLFDTVAVIGVVII